MNGNRIPPEVAHQLRLGDSVRLGVPLNGPEVEFDYILIKRPLKDIKQCLAKEKTDEAKTAHLSKKPKRKLDEVEPSTSKPKLSRRSSADENLASPCPVIPVNKSQRTSLVHSAETGTSSQVIEVGGPSESSLHDVEQLQM